MFCPAIGIDEDPVSGNAHALLAMHLHSLGFVPQRDGRLGFRGRQGHHLGRPGVVDVLMHRAGAGIGSVQIEGSAAIAFEANIALA